MSCTGPPQPLNVVVILVDDLGWMDTGVYGSTFYETPAIDRLANEGVRFTQFYAASGVCSPTRASLMTGKYPARLGITDFIGRSETGPLLTPENVRALPLEEYTIGEVFRDAGYATGYVGKWHLGGEGFMPEDQGFEYSRAVNYRGSSGTHFPPYHRFNTPVLLSETDSTDVYLTDRLTDHAVAFLEERGPDPFFLVLSHYAVHTPIQAKEDLINRFELRKPASDTSSAFLPEDTLGTTKQWQDDAVYAAMMASVDESVDRVLAALDSMDLSDRTIVVFTSDNGGLSTLRADGRWAPTANLPLRAGKGYLYEGGIRIPLVVRHPDGPRGSVTHWPAATVDLLPTLVGLVGLADSPGVDGIDLSGLWTGEPPPDRLLFWHYPHYHRGSGNRPSGAVRSGDHKLLEWFEGGRTELYDLSRDAAESVDVSGDFPEKHAELLGALRSWRIEVDARVPRPRADTEPQ